MREKARRLELGPFPHDPLARSHSKRIQQALRAAGPLLLVASC